MGRKFPLLLLAAAINTAGLWAYLTRPVTYRIRITLSLDTPALPVRLAVAVPLSGGSQQVDLRRLVWQGRLRHESRGQLEVYWLEYDQPAVSEPVQAHFEWVVTLPGGRFRWRAPMVFPAAPNSNPLFRRAVGLRLPAGTRATWDEIARQGWWRFATPPLRHRFLSYGAQADVDALSLEMAAWARGSPAWANILAVASAPLRESIEVQQISR